MDGPNAGNPLVTDGCRDVGAGGVALDASEVSAPSATGYCDLAQLQEPLVWKREMRDLMVKRRLGESL